MLKAYYLRNNTSKKKIRIPKIVLPIFGVLAFYHSIPFVSITLLYQSNDFFLYLLPVPFPSSSKST